MSVAPAGTRRQPQARLARTMLLYLLPITLVPLVLMVGWSIWQARTMLRQQVFNVMSEAADAQGQSLVAEVQLAKDMLARQLYSSDMTQTLQTLLTSPDRTTTAFKQARLILFNRLLSISSSRPLFNQFLVVDEEGTILAATHQDWEGKSLENSLLFSPTQLPEEPKTILSKIVLGPKELYDSDRNTLSVITWAKYDLPGGPSGFILGITETTVVRDWMVSAAQFSAEPGEANHYFVTSDGQFIGVSPYPNSYDKLITISVTGAYLNEIKSGLTTGDRKGVDEVTAKDRGALISAYTWLPDLSIGWVTEVTQKSVYGPLNSLLWVALALFVITFALVSFVLWRVTESLVQPIRALSRTVQRFAEGNWEQRAIIHHEDEVGQLADSFNHMAEDLTNLYHSMEMKVEERTRQVRAVTEFSQAAASASSLEDLLSRTIDTVSRRFGFLFAGVFLVEGSENLDNRYLLLRQAQGPQEIEQKLRGRLIRVDTRSLLGWVVLNKHARSDTPDGSFGSLLAEGHSNREHLLNDARSEVAVPIILGQEVLGVFWSQSMVFGGYKEEQLNELQTLLTQTASSIRNFQLLETTQVDLQETNLLYQASYRIAQAETSDHVFQIAFQALGQTQFSGALLLPTPVGLRVVLPQILADPDSDSSGIQTSISTTPDELKALLLSSGSGAASIILDQAALNEKASERQAGSKTSQLPDRLLEWVQLWSQWMGSETVALLPVARAGQVASVMVLGSRQKATDETGQVGLASFTAVSLQPYANLTELTTTTLEKIQALDSTNKNLKELQTLSNVSQSISMETDLSSLFRVLHEQIVAVMGNVSFLVALYDNQTQLISMPYMWNENNGLMHVDPFPLGKGLTSLLITTRQPLMLLDNLPERSAALGSITVGSSAKSWLGVPLLVGGEAIGAFVVQDTEQEFRFTEDDKRLLTTLASQVAIVIRNARLIEASRKQAEHERLLFEISSKIRRSVDMESILETTARELGSVLKAKRAHIEIQVASSNPSAGSSDDGWDNNAAEAK